MKQIAFALLTICCFGSSAFAQVAPAATSSGALSPIRGLEYAFRYAQTAQFQTGLPTQQTSVVSGNVSYSNRPINKPFSMAYAGGYTWTLSGPNYPGGQFHRLFLSQGFNFHRWKFVADNDVAYLPQTPTSGFSGIPGIGEVIGSATPPSSTNLSILAFNTHVLNNSASVQLEHTLNYATTATIGGNSDLVYFPNNDGINSRSVTANGQITRRLNARASFGGQYAFTQFEFPGTSVLIYTHTGLVGLDRRITRNLTVIAYAGPQWIESTASTLVPTQIGYAANASASYTKRFTTLSATYDHGTNGGSGYLIGGTLDDVEGNLLRQITPNVSLGFNGGYQRTASFNSSGVTNAAFGATQATWQVGRSLIVFANYTGRGQTSSSQLPGNVLNNTVHFISFGFGFSPREGRFRP